ncbi:hypothetical protein Aperf_G00000084833 [Anoplocephala perfoliata]
MKIAQKLVILNSSVTFNLTTSPSTTDLQVYLFSLANLDDVKNEKVKPILRTLGPYVYRREVTKINISYIDNGTSRKYLRFTEYNRCYFEPEKSVGDPKKDIIIIPNIIKILNNSFDGPYTINTGEGDITKIGKLEAYEDKTILDVWDSDYANMLNGTTIGVTPPGVKLGDKRYVFCPGLCRSLSFTATEWVTSKHVPQLKLLKLKLDKEQLQSVYENPENAVFNEKVFPTDRYAPSGLWDINRCLNLSFDVPLYVSMPYFHLVDEKTKNDIIFESPIQQGLEPYFLIDPLVSADKEASELLYKSAYEVPMSTRTSLRQLIGIVALLTVFLFAYAVLLKYRERAELRSCEYNRKILEDLELVFRMD